MAYFQIIFPCLNLLCLIRAISSAPTNFEPHNEIYLTLRQTDNPNDPEISSEVGSLSKKEDGLPVDTDEPSNQEANFDLPGTMPRRHAEQRTKKISSREENSERSRPKNVDENVTEIEARDEILRQEQTDSPNESRLESKDSPELQEEPTDGFRFKKQAHNTKYSEPKPFEYNFHDPSTGKFGFHFFKV